MTQWHHVNSFKLVIDKQLIQLFNTENKILFTKKKSLKVIKYMLIIFVKAKYKIQKPLLSTNILILSC